MPPAFPARHAPARAPQLGPWRRGLVRALTLTAAIALLLTGTVQAAEATTLTGKPIGNVDSVSAVAGGVRVKGWAWDPDSTASVTVVVTVGSKSQQTTANTYRPDVARVFPDAGSNRGFDTTVTVPDGTVQVCVTAKNIGSGTDRVWSCRTVTVGTATTTAAASTATAGSTNTGVPAGTPLKVWAGDLTVTTPGTVIDGLDIRGYLRIKAENVTVKNSIIRGRDGLTSSMSLIQSSSPGVTITDSELVAAYPSYWIDGFVGNNATFTRVNIHGVVDSIKLTGDNVLVQDSWLHDNLYYAMTPSGHDTHTDNVQIQRGTNITVRNTVMSGTHNAAMMITQDSGAVSNVTWSNNRADNGACTINVAEKTYGPVQGLKVMNTVFGFGTTVARCAILLPDTTKAIATISGNVWTDGSAVSVSRG